MANKVTKKEVITTMLNDEHIKENKVFVDFLTHELELLNKKKNSAKMTKTQEENEVLKDTIIKTLEEIGSGTVSEIQNANADLKELSNQKVSALLRLLVESGDVKRSIGEKRKAIFTVG